MNLWKGIRTRLCCLWRRSALKREIDEELRFHLDQRTAENLAAGLSPEEAAREARKRFGNWQAVREQCRETRGTGWGEEVMRDLRFAFRQLAKSPGFTTVAVLSLALGIGAGTAVFSVANAVLLRSLPVPNPHELRGLRWTGSEVRIPSLSGDTAFPHPIFQNLRDQEVGQAAIFGFSPLEDVIVRARNETFSANGMMVSDNFFSGLGVQPILGRALIPGEDYAGGGRSVVISYEWWDKHFGREPAILGQTLTLNGNNFTVVGVLGQGFKGVQPGASAGFYVPMSSQSQFLYRPITENFHWFVRLMARLKPGAGESRLRSALDVAFAREAGAFMKEPKIIVQPGRGGPTFGREQYRRPLLLMMGVVGLVILVACANLAGLSLARGAARQHELAVRAALGAGRWRLMRQSFTESLVLALLGGGIGVAIAVWARAGIAQFLVGSSDGLRYDLALDRSVLVFAIGMVLVTGLLSGLAPAWRASRVDPLGGLKSRGALGAPRLRIGRILVVTQICLTLLLLAGAGLYARTLLNLSRINAGFAVEKLLLFQLNIRGSSYAQAQPAEFYARVQESLMAMPGVQGASLIEFPLLNNSGSSGGVDFVGHPTPVQSDKPTCRLTVGESFFTTMGIPILQGRGFGLADAEGTPKVIVVNESFVREFLPRDNPLGQSIRMWEAQWQIVGVCRDAKYSNLKEPPVPAAYFPFRQRLYSRFRQTHLRSPYFAVRTALPPLVAAAAARKTVAAISSDVLLDNITTQEEVRDMNISQERLLATLCGALAALALLLSCVGLYGLMAYHVARRTSEFAIRMALGAARGQITGPIVREVLLLTACGVAAGVPAALALTRLIRSQLYGVAPTDLSTWLGAALLLLIVAIFSAWIPARRAACVDPMTALKCE